MVDMMFATSFVRSAAMCSSTRRRAVMNSCGSCALVTLSSFTNSNLRLSVGPTYVRARSPSKPVGEVHAPVALVVTRQPAEGRADHRDVEAGAIVELIGQI